MKNKRVLATLAVLVISGLVVAGCETMAQSGALGGVIGAATGAAIGSASGHAGEGAAIGAGVGILAGLIAHDIKTRQMKTAQQTAQEYNYVPSQGFKMDVKSGTITPVQVKPGQKVVSTIQYAVLGTGPGVKVHEIAALKHNGQVDKISDRTIDRTDGTYENTLELEVPGGAAPGSYVLAQEISANNQTYGRDTTFSVLGTTASSKIQVGGTVEVRMAAIH